MRLIDADVLKEVIIANHYLLSTKHNSTDYGMFTTGIIEAIDNATPIEYTFEEAFQKTVCEKRLYCPARPHGKWIFRNGGYYKCDKCGEVERAEKNYCPNCGAKMGGGRQ